MAQIEIDGLGLVDVDENFFKLSPKEQNDFVDQAVIQDAIEGTGRAFATGMLFNFRDEVVAALSEPASFVGSFMDEGRGEEYRKELTKQRLLENVFRRQEPALSIGAEIAGGIAVPAGVLGTAARGATLGSKLLRASGAGAAMGGVSGLGAGEDVDTRLSEAAKTATAGAVVAPVAAATFPALGRVVAPVARTAGRLAESAVVEPSVRAARMVARRLKDAGVTSDALEALKRDPKPMAIADIDSSGIRSLARLVAQSGGKGAELAESLNIRQFGDDAIEGAAKRIEQDLISAGVPKQSAIEAKAGIDMLKGVKSSELYDKSNAFSIPKELRQELKPLFARPSMKGIIAEAKSLAKEEGERFTGTTIDNIDMRGLDYVQRRLRARSSSAYASNDSMVGKAIKETREKLLDKLDTANDDFRKARSLYADASARQEALDAGRKFKKLQDQGEISEFIKDYGADELQNFRIGMAQTIRNDLEGIGFGADFAGRLAGTRRKLQQLEEAFPKKGFQDLKSAFEKESQMASTRQKTLFGSQSFQTGAEAMRAGAEDASMAERIISGARQGGIAGGVAEGVAPLIKQASMGIGKRTDRELGKLLFSTNPAERAAAIARVQSSRGAGRPMGSPIIPQRPEMPSLASRVARQVPAGVGRGLLYSLGETVGSPMAGMLSPITSAQASMPQDKIVDSYTTQSGAVYDITEGGKAMLRGQR